MKNAAETDDKVIISVVDEFDYSSQNEAYNNAFKKWRKNKENPYAFNFEMNKKESVFVDGQGFEVRSSADAETAVIIRIMNVIGIAMLMWVVIDNILGKIFVQLFELLGFDIHTSFFSTAVHGGSVEIVSALIAIAALKIIFPLLYMHKKLKMPRRVEFMRTLNRPADLIRAIGMTLVVCTVTSIPNVYSDKTKQIYTYFKSLDADVSVWGQEEFLIYSVFDIIILSILIELLFRGAVFGALRQFGDVFAIDVTSIMAGLLVQDFIEVPEAILISAVASIGMLRSGSIFTAFFVRIIYKMYELALIIIEVDVSEKMVIKRSVFMIGAFEAGAAVVMLIHFMEKRRQINYFAGYSSELTMGKRLITALKAFPFPAVGCICLLAALIKIAF